MRHEINIDTVLSNPGSDPVRAARSCPHAADHALPLAVRVPVGAVGHAPLPCLAQGPPRPRSAQPQCPSAGTARKYPRRSGKQPKTASSLQNVLEITLNTPPAKRPQAPEPLNPLPDGNAMPVHSFGPESVPSSPPLAEPAQQTSLARMAFSESGTFLWKDLADTTDPTPKIISGMSQHSMQLLARFQDSTRVH